MNKNAFFSVFSAFVCAAIVFILFLLISFTQVIAGKHEVAAAADLLALEYAMLNQYTGEFDCGLSEIKTVYKVDTIDCTLDTEDVQVGITKNIRTVLGLSYIVKSFAKAGPIY